ncbi:alkane oxidation protein activator PraB [Pseudomonas yamanorum]|uniref:Protein activator of alkane oxidation PraB n=1 Tax=Pseudomonas yamanorum TaxID=515393 RepID=A0A7Y8EGZ8_9PSED|nr:alkane oxidation protein activator PraB [Pseudomonas yamanorum]NWE14422.1 protein activator of alkane oxidation PraB [Pseudomonas yamanorum]
MQSLVKTALLGSMLAALGVASSMAVAAGFSPPGPFSGTNGSVVLKLPSTFQAPMTCGLSLSGAIDANGVAIISSAVPATNGLCPLLKVTGLPWTVNLSSTTQGSLNNIGFSMAKLGVPGDSVCGPVNVVASWDNSTHVLSATNQAMSGYCTLVSLNATLTGSLTTNP